MLNVLVWLIFFQSLPALSFLDQLVLSANKKIVKEPARPEGYNELALGLIRKERETGDISLLMQAEAAVRKSLELEPVNFDARKARVAIRLRQHRFEDALEEAQALHKQTPDENSIYGFISEAQLAIGNYAAAENSVQFMINLRQVNGPGHERGAMVREYIGFPDGAIDWWNSALHLSSERDTEERAYIYSQLTRVYRETGRYNAARESAQQALILIPDYPPAQYELAHVCIDQAKGKEAISLLKALQGKQPSLEIEYYIARVLDLLGDATSVSAWASFEKHARTAVDSPANENALFVRYLADHGKASEGVSSAKQFLVRRHDVFMLDAYAWALFRAGQAMLALGAIEKALEPGMRDAPLYFDAGMIAKAAKQNAKASEYFKKSFEINSNSLAAAETLKQLSLLSTSLPN